jgi:hypothetical protein
MKKKLLFGIMIIPLFTYAQVGIKNTYPASTLDITAKNATGTSTNVDGLLVPRVDRQKAQSMTSIPISTLIFVNDVSTGTQTGTAIDMDAMGYYFYNGTSWTKLNPNVTIYNSDETLTSNRTVKQNTNTLAFKGTVKNLFSVDGNTFSVDAANDRVGIGTDSPTSKLEINSGVANDSGMKFSNINSSSPISNGKALAVDATGKVVTISTSAPLATIVANNTAPNTGSGTNSSWTYTYNHSGGLAYITAMATCWANGATPSNGTALSFTMTNSAGTVVVNRVSHLPAAVPINVRISMPPFFHAVNLPAGTYTIRIFKEAAHPLTLVDAADVASITILTF